MMDGWDWVWGSLMMVAFWAGLVVVVIVAVKALGSSRRSHDQPDSREILLNRYARGEITEEEFETRMNVLDSRAA